MELQSANSVVISDGVTADDLLLQYGKIQDGIASDFIFRDLVNTQYINEPVKGGTVKVKRMKISASQPYGTARAAREANKLQNNYAKVDVDTDREIAEEMDAKDMKLWAEEGSIAVLENRQPSFSLGMGIELEEAYFTKLQQLAVANGLVNVSGESDVQDKLTLLINTLGAVENDNVNKVPRRMMVLTLASKWYDALEKELTTLENPISGRTDAKMFREVEVRRAERQGFDAIVQAIGSVAQPVVMGDFKVEEIQLSADGYAYMPYFYGTDGVMGELVYACALDSDISA
jgi:hypothetical protein